MKVLTGDKTYQFNNGENPVAQVVAVAKRKIEAGEFIKRGLGSFDIRGEAVKIENYQDAVPITLVYNARFTKPVEEGQIVKFTDVELPKTRALEMWQQILADVEKDSNKKPKRIETKDPVSPLSISANLRDQIKALFTMNFRTVFKTINLHI